MDVFEWQEAQLVLYLVGGYCIDRIIGPIVSLLNSDEVISLLRAL